MLKIYGSMLCPDCIRCLRDLEKAAVPYVYYDFSRNLIFLKEFLALRESNAAFRNARASGTIGIPAIVRPDGTVTLSWDSFCK